MCSRTPALRFKWIKQHLRIRSFYGRSENAVRVQIWSAICAYLMVAIVRKQFDLQKNLNEILQIVSINIFEQTPLAELLSKSPLQESIIGKQPSEKFALAQRVISGHYCAAAGP
jgi:hypothetical protein